MHLVFLNQYYPPDAAPTGVMLRAVAEECARQGHQVTVICAAGGYADSRHKPSRRRTQEGEEENVASVDDRRGQPTISRIGATRFGRGTFVGKLLDYASYYVGVAWRLGTMSPPPDRMVALTTPPYLSVLARAVSKLRGADHAHWVMDLYPDVMVAHGMLAEGGWKHRLLAGLARWGFGGRRCAAVLTLGPDMADRVGGHGDGSLPVSWVPLWGGEVKAAEETGGGASVSVTDGPSRSISPGEMACALREKRGWAANDLVVMYSGNMGLGHRFGEILALAGPRASRPAESMEGESAARQDSVTLFTDASFAAHRQGEPGDSRSGGASVSYRFVFYGGGKRRGEIEAFMAANPEAPVELHDYAPAEELGAHLLTADVHLVSLEPAWSGTMVPSKLQGIFAVGRPVVFIGSAESSIGRWVEESGGGWVVAAGDVDGLRVALEEACDPEVRQVRGGAAGRFAQECFDRETNGKRVVKILVGDA